MPHGKDMPAGLAKRGVGLRNGRPLLTNVAAPQPMGYVLALLCKQLDVLQLVERKIRALDHERN